MSKQEIRSEVEFIIFLHNEGVENNEIVKYIKIRRKSIKEIRKFMEECK